MLENPPLIEAFCAFELSSGDHRDWSTVERFYQRIAETYPLKQTSDDPEDEEDENERLLRYHAHDEKIAVNLGIGAVSINQIDGHITWLDYKPHILNVFSIFCDVFEVSAVKSLTLRYINRLHLTGEPMHYDEFLNVAPMLPVGKRDMPWISWSQRVAIYYEKLDSYLFILGQTYPDTEPGEHSSVLLDISMRTSEELKKDGVEYWLEESHREIEKTFFDSLTDVSRKVVGWKEGN